MPIRPAFPPPPPAPASGVSLPFIHPATMETFQHHEALPRKPKKLSVNVVGGGGPAVQDIKTPPPAPPPPRPRPVHNGPPAQALTKPISPFVHHLHSPSANNIPKLIFSPLKKGPKAILVETARQVFKPPRPAGPPPELNPASIVLTTPGPNQPSFLFDLTNGG